MVRVSGCDRRSARVRGGLPIVAVMALLLVGGCAGSSDVLEASDPVFAGLDPAVVQEVLSSDAARDRVAGDDPATAASRYQGMVRNFSFCRSALEVYETWMRTGVAPEFPSQDVPENPAASADTMDREIRRVERLVGGGDISLLRADLTNENGGCGVWIPANPGEPEGPTIADVVNGRAR